MSSESKIIDFKKIKSALLKMGSLHDIDDQHLLRIQFLLLNNQHLIENKKILELGPGHGHFSRVMSLMNAKLITAIEGHQEHFVKFEERKKRDGIPDSNIELIHGYFDEIPTRFQNKKFDTLFFAGSFYHIHNHFDFLRTLYNLNASHLILETATLDPSIKHKFVEFLIEDTNDHWNAASHNQQKALVGIPSQSAVELMLQHSGWNIVKKYDYQNYQIPGSIKSIERGSHVAYICERVC